MSQSNAEVVKGLYAAFARGDAPAALALMDPAIVWLEAENVPYADHNPYIGPTAVAEGIFLRLATEWDNFQAIPEAFHDAGETILVTGRYRGTYKATGIPLDAQFAHVWRLANQKLIAFQQYTDTAQASHAVHG